MSSTDNNNPPGKPNQRSRKPKQQANKSDERESLKGDQPQRSKREQPRARPQDNAPIHAAAAAESFPISPQASTAEPLTSPSVVSTESPPKGALVRIDAVPIATSVSVDSLLTGFQSIANAYRDYTRRSLEETMCFVEKLAGVRSLDKAVEVQSEFAKQACETFLVDSQRIWRLYSEIARQVFRPFERLVTRVTQAAR
jgi:phasin family protein